MKKLIIMLSLASLTLAACKKTEPEIKDPVRPENLNEVVASDYFDWPTTKRITLNLKGFNASYNSPGLIQVTDEAGVVYYKGMHLNSADFAQEITVPSTLKVLNVRFGVMNKSFDVRTTSKINSNLLPELPEVE